MTPDHGFRVEAPSASSAWVRDAAVYDPDGVIFDELTLGAHLCPGRWTFGAEVAGAFAYSERYRRVVLGNAALLAGAHTEWERGTLVYVARATIPMPSTGVATTFWGTTSDTIVPQWGLSGQLSSSYREIIWQARLGVRSIGPGAWAPDIQTGFAWVHPLVPQLDFVMEIEALLDIAPGHARLMARMHPNERWDLDLGLAAGVPGIITDPTIDVILGARTRFGAP